MSGKWYDMANEKSRPKQAQEELKKKQERAAEIRKLVCEQANNRAARFSGVPNEPSELVDGITKSQNKWTEKYVAWKQEFEKFRNKQRNFAQAFGRISKSTPVVVYTKKAKFAYDLKNYQPLDIPQDGSFALFNNLWKQYDEEGSGFLSYKDFRKLLNDLGFEFGFGPGWTEIDPLKTRQVTFERAASWWFKGDTPAARTKRASRQKRMQVDAVQCLEEAQKERKAKQFKLLSSNKVRSIRERAKQQGSQDSATFRKFRQDARKKHDFDADFSVEVFDGKRNKFSYKFSEAMDDATDISPAQDRILSSLWNTYDEKQSGYLSMETFCKLIDEVTNTAGHFETFPEEFKSKKQVSYADFKDFWFSNEPEKPEPRKQKEDGDEKAEEADAPTYYYEFGEKGKEQKFEIKGVRPFPVNYAPFVPVDRKALRSKYNEVRKAFRSFRRKHYEPSQQEFNLDVTIQQSKKTFNYKPDDYQPAFVPKGNEYQLDQIDRVWKTVDKEGLGFVNKSEFETFLKGINQQIKDESVFKSLLNKNGDVDFERVATWWFSNSEGIIPAAPPVDEDKIKKAQAIKDKKTGRLAVEITEAPTDKEWATQRQNARKKYDEKRAEFRQKRNESSPRKARRARIGNSPTKAPSVVPLNKLKMELFYKDRETGANVQSLLGDTIVG